GGAVIGLAILLLSLSRADTAEPVDPKAWDAVTGKAVVYLKKSQAEDGSWSKAKSPGCTGIVLTGLLESGKVTAQDPMAEKALKYIESLVNVKAGHIAGADPKPQLLNYVTSINVMALQSAKRPDLYGKIVKDGTAFLKKLQWDEGNGKAPKD